MARQIKLDSGIVELDSLQRNLLIRILGEAREMMIPYSASNGGEGIAKRLAIAAIDDLILAVMTDA